MNQGKRFENDIKESVPEHILLYRLNDAAQSFGRSGDLRFSLKNPFDYIMWDSNNRHLYALELKTVSGKSISFEREKEDKGIIHYHQILGLNKWNEYNGVICGFVIFFREIEKTVFIEISDFNELISVIDKKSFSFDDLDKHKIRNIIIPQTKKRTRYKYDILDFIDKTKSYKI